jgi:hypothetical protein
MMAERRCHRLRHTMRAMACIRAVSRLNALVPPGGPCFSQYNSVSRPLPARLSGPSCLPSKAGLIEAPSRNFSPATARWS